MHANRIENTKAGYGTELKFTRDFRLDGGAVA